MKWVAIETSVIVICITIGMIVTKTAWPLLLLVAVTSKINNNNTHSK